MRAFHQVPDSSWTFTNTSCFSYLFPQALKSAVIKFLKMNNFGDSLVNIYRTALVNVFNDIHLNKDSGRISLSVLLDLSAAFETVDHNILLGRLKN